MSRLRDRARKILATTFRRDEVELASALLRKLVGDRDYAVIARGRAMAGLQRKFARLVEKAGRHGE